ncbi:MAG: S49 family peptidase [Bacteroidia bacterium]|nr:MAG: S49 family peptidase [Bacteroidia bacterium]
MEQNNWEKNILQQLLFDTLKEQKASRRWRIFFRLIWIIIIGAILYLIFSPSSDQFNITKNKNQVAIVNLSGTISGDTHVYETVSEGLENALKNKHVVAVIIKADSPGGSPVYSDMLYNKVLELRKKYPHKPIDVVVEEVCASGCYYIAAAAHKIYAEPASIVGSIGVIYTGFGVTGLMQKAGIDSRLLISGKNKAMGYPFIPENKDQTVIQQSMLDEIHQQFISAVEKGRGKILNTSDPEIFSGRYWIGQDALKLGLIDGYSTVEKLARDVYHTDNLVDYTPDQDKIDRLLRKFGTDLVGEFKQTINKSNFGWIN